MYKKIINALFGTEEKLEGVKGKKSKRKRSEICAK